MSGDVIGFLLGARSSAPADGWIGRWRPGIGDPTVVGWLIVGAYALAAWLCWRARRVAIRETGTGSGRGSAAFWGLLCALMIILGLNKQLDIQTGITEFGRVLARAQGWYEQRQTVQLIFVGVVALGAALTIGWTLYLARHDRRRLWPAVFGGVGFFWFIVLRAISFHRLKRFTPSAFSAPWTARALELTCIGLVCFGASRFTRRRSAKSVGVADVSGQR